VIQLPPGRRTCLQRAAPHRPQGRGVAFHRRFKQRIMLRLFHRRSRPVHIFSDRNQSIRRPGKPTPSLSAESPNPSLVWVPHVSLETRDLPPPTSQYCHSVGPQIRAPFIARSLRDVWDRAATLQQAVSISIGFELTYSPCSQIHPHPAPPRPAPQPLQTPPRSAPQSAVAQSARRPCPHP